MTELLYLQIYTTALPGSYNIKYNFKINIKQKLHNLTLQVLCLFGQ